MGHCMTVLILSFTIFLLLFSITIPSINSLECYEHVASEDSHTVRIMQCKEHQQCKVVHESSYTKVAGCTTVEEENQAEPGCVYLMGWFLTCFCPTNLCNDVNNPQWQEGVKCWGNDTATTHKTYHRVKGLSMCYYKSETDLKSGTVTKKGGTMNNAHCQSLNIPGEQKCTRKFDNDHGKGPLKDIIECCCEEEYCNDIHEKDIPPKGVEPLILKCASFPESKEMYCDTTYIDPICWYQEKQDMATNESPSKIGHCVDKTKHKECNTIAENTCKRSNDENTAITTVDCCCKQNECNTPEGLASQRAMQPIPLKCNDFNGTFTKNVKKWCNKDEICWYQEKLQMTSEGGISVHGHCGKNDPNVCKAGINTCNRVAREKEGISQMNCCCNSTFCNAPEEQKKYYQPPKEIKCFQSMTADNATNSQWCMNENQICLLQSKQVLGIADTVITWKGECIEKANSDKTTKKQVCHQDTINKCIRSLNKDDPGKPVSQVDCCCDTANCNNHNNANFAIPKFDVHKCITFMQGEKAVSKFCKETNEICWYKSTQTLRTENGKVQVEGGCVELEKCPLGIKNGTTCKRDPKQISKKNAITTVDCCCKDGHDCNDPAKLKDKIPPVPTLPPTTPEPTEEELNTAAPEEQPEETEAAAVTRVQLKVVAIAMLIAVVQHL